MRLQTVSKVMMTGIILLASSGTMGQTVEMNGTQIAAYESEGNMVNKAVSKQTSRMTETALLQSAIGTEYAYIKQWEGKYNSYLKTATGYAEALKGATSLYAEGVTTLRHLYEIQNAINNNPEGVLATVSMNNVYAEAATELIKTYRVLKYAIAVGTQNNMLTGAERTELLWQIDDELRLFNRKLRKMALSIAYYNMTDVWNRATQGMVDMDKGDIARKSFDRWKRAQTAYHNLRD